MAFSESYKEYIEDLFSRINLNINTKKMFGGVCFFYKSKAFGLISEDEFYLKVDDSNIELYKDSKPFSPFETYKMKYYKVSDEKLEDLEEFMFLVNKTIDIIEK